MTNIEFFRAVAANEINDEVIAKAVELVAKDEAAKAKRKNSESKTHKANAELADSLVEKMEANVGYTAAQIGEILEVTTSKATAVAKILVERNQATVAEVKGEKGKCKAYTLA